MLDVKKDFPILIHPPHPSYSYLDTAASSLKPKVVTDRLSEFYSYQASNVHRGAHQLSQQATSFYEESRSVIKDFINAYSENEIIFTSGTTESVNLVAFSFGEMQIKNGDVILLTELEHHSNIVPWQQMAQRKGAQVQFVKIKESGELDLEDFNNKLTEKVKMVSLTYCSNVLGVLTPLSEIIEKAHGVGAKVFVDAAQAVSTLKIDVQDLDCDFLAFSAHKMFGPYGVGVLYGKETLLNELPPYKSGGSMIQEVKKQGSTFLKSPQRFEAGTPAIAEVIGLAEAAKYIQSLGYKNILAHEKNVLAEGKRVLSEIPNLKIYGSCENIINILSFNFTDIHPNDVATILDQEGVAVRSGHHCAQPLMEVLGAPGGTLRASFSIYNDLEDVNKLKQALLKARGFFV